MKNTKELIEKLYNAWIDNDNDSISFCRSEFEKIFQQYINQDKKDNFLHNLRSNLRNELRDLMISHGWRWQGSPHDGQYVKDENLKIDKSKFNWKLLPLCVIGGIYNNEKSCLASISIKRNESYQVKIQSRLEEIPISIDSLERLKEISYEKILDLSVGNISSIQSCASVLPALVLFCGRRPFSELILNGDFDFHPLHDDHVLFRGLAKHGEDKKSDVVEIPLWGCEADIFIDSFYNLRDIFSDRSWFLSGNPQKVRSALYRGIDSGLQDYRWFFDSLKKSGWISNDEKDKLYDFRKIYAAACYFYAKSGNLHFQGQKKKRPTLKSDQAVATWLHHEKETSSGKKLKDTRSTQSYLKYQVIAA